jgi:hypothetical protein
MKRPIQLELFADGARTITARAKPRAPDQVRLQTKLAAARQRVRSLIVLGMNPAVPEELRLKVREAERWTREQVRVIHEMLCRG